MNEAVWRVFTLHEDEVYSLKLGHWPDAPTPRWFAVLSVDGWEFNPGFGGSPLSAVIILEKEMRSRWPAAPRPNAMREELGDFFSVAREKIRVLELL